MADPTGEGHLKHQPGVQLAEIPAASFPPVNEKSIIPNQEKENMEVHHHAHHDHGKKNWKSYFWEFMMLFLAVFCGFLAEYQLEQTIERHREKEYMQSMLEDLRSDRNSMSRSTKLIDSLLLPFFEKSTELLYSEDFSDSAIADMYEYVPKTPRFLSVNFEDRTIRQLKNSGNLRLIRDKDVTDSLASYWAMCDGLTNLVLPGYAETRSNVKGSVLSLFNMNYYEGNQPMSSLKKDRKAFKLLSKDKTEFIKLGNLIANLNSQAAGPIKSAIGKADKQAIDLIKIIRDKYDLE